VYLQSKERNGNEDRPANFCRVAESDDGCIRCRPGCSRGQQGSQGDVEKTWQWVSTITPVEKITVPDPEWYTIRLTEEGKIQAQFEYKGRSKT